MSPEIVQVPVAGTDNFAYLVICTQTGKAIGIDPGLKPESLLRVVRSRQLSLEVLANTHGHRDHIAGNAEVLKVTGAKLAANPLDVPEAEILLDEGHHLQVGMITVSVLHTPGHTPGSMVFNPPGALITGDTLFVTRCGRADFPRSDPDALYRSLLRLAAFPPETQVFPGHDYGPKAHSTIAFEQEHNAYMKCPDLESFLRLRMG
jgi:glyoxylase-like metal-dependent hydrolase (beta-lactamase superfamily II)